MLPEVNIGTVGHVDHGKTSLVYALTGKWADTHSEEIKRGITIRLGYADATFYYCKKCGTYSNSEKCMKCLCSCEPKRAVSFVDAPGHETLMATVLSGAVLMDGALLLIAANEKCPQPQTAEHLKALDIVGINKIIIVQNKIDLVTEEGAKKNYEEIKEFVKGTVAENAPIIPISAIHNVNIDILIEAIENYIKTPERDLKKDPKFFIARSFDINRPGTATRDLKGGVIGGSLVSGRLKLGDKIEIRPGVNADGKWIQLKTMIADIMQFNHKLEEACPGGLVAIQIELDPSLTRGDNLTGNIAGLEGRLPGIMEELKLCIELFDYVIGVKGYQKISRIKTGDTLMLTVAIAKSVGVVKSSHGNICELRLKIPVCADKNDKVAISQQIGGRWHLVGWGTIL